MENKETEKLGFLGIENKAQEPEKEAETSEKASNIISIAYNQEDISQDPEMIFKNNEIE